MACKVYIYVNDGQRVKHSEVTYWEAARRFCLVCVFLGIQDPQRKRTRPSLYAGPWASTTIHMGRGVVATGTQDKWQKMRELVLELGPLV